MNLAYDEVISASDADRGALFAEPAARLGTPDVAAGCSADLFHESLRAFNLVAGIDFRMPGVPPEKKFFAE